MGKIKCLFGWHSWKWKAIKLNNTLDLTMPKWAICENCLTCLDKKLTSKTKVFCTCNNELVSTNCFIENGSKYSMFICKVCKEESIWDFGCPTPIKLK